MSGLPYVTPDGRVVVLGPGELPPPGSRPAGPLGSPSGPSQAPVGGPSAPMPGGPVGGPQVPPQGPQGAPTPPQGQPSAPSPDGLGQLGPDNDSSSAWFAAAAAAAQNMNNPVAALTSGLSALTGKLEERDQARRLIKRQEALDKLQARRVDIEQQQVDAQKSRWEAEGPYREAQARHMNAQADQIAQQMQDGTIANLGDGVIMIRKPGEAPQRVVVAPELLSLAQSKVNAERARIALMDRDKYMKGEMVNGPDGQTYMTRYNGKDGVWEFGNTSTGEWSKNVPGGPLMRPQDTGARKAGELAAVDENDGYKAATQAAGKIANYDRMLSILGSSGVGAGATAEARRQLGEFLGTDIGDMNLADKQVQNSLIRQMEIEAAGQFKGQGQITENERAILRQSIASLDQDPKAFSAIVDIFRKRAQKQVDLMIGWDAMKPDQRSAQPFAKYQFGFYNRPDKPQPETYKTPSGLSYTVE